MSIVRCAFAALLLSVTSVSGAEVPDITPPELDDGQTIVKFPGTVSETAVGGGGRYLCFHLKSLRQVAVFDVNQAKIVKYLPADDDDVLLAGGADKLLILLQGKGLLLRYSLTNLERELTTQCPVRPVAQMVMGSASNGPVLLAADNSRIIGPRGGCTFLDVDTMKPLDLHVNFPGFIRWDRSTPVAASPDGRLIVVSGSGSYVFRLNERSVEVRRGEPHGTLIPGPLGRYVYGAFGPFTPELRPLGNPVKTAGRQCLPALRGSYYVSLTPGNFDRIDDMTTYDCTLHVAGDTRPLLSGLDIGLKGSRFARRDALPLHKRVFFVPPANLVAVVPHTYDRLILTKLDVIEALDASGIDYLFVTSQPPTGVRPGESVKYQIAVRSKRGSVKFKLDAGPESARLSPSGLLTWQVPEGATEGANVITSISDASGQEIFHTFKLALAGATAAGTRPPIRPPVPPRPPQLPPVPQIRPAPPTATAQRPPATPPSFTTGDVKLPKIEPPELPDSPKEVKLPAGIADIAVGGGGRWLILQLDSLQKLAVFDVNRASIVKYIPAADTDLHFTAGANQLIVSFGSKGVISRYNLETMERELTLPLDVGVVKNLCMGCASAGPLLLVSAAGTDALARGSYTFIDPQTLKPLDVTMEGGRLHLSYRDFMHVRASANGTLFTMWCSSHSPHGVNALVFHGNSAKAFYEHTSEGFVLPSPDGRIVCTGYRMYTNQLVPLSEEGGPHNSIPSVHGKYYISLGDRVGGVALGQTSTVQGGRLHMFGDDRPLLTLSDVEFPYGLEVWADQNFVWDKHIQFIPQANLLVVIPYSNDRLMLHKLDVDEALEESGIDYLLVASQPPLAVKAGSELDYQLEVKSKKGGLKYKLEAGPAGMSIDAGGKLTWSVPGGAGGKQNVIITVTDAAGQEIFHTFNIEFVGRTSGRPTARPPNAGEEKPPRVPAVTPEDKIKASAYLQVATQLADRNPAAARRWARKAIETAPGTKMAEEAAQLLKQLEEKD